ncbi:maltose O-acetyltransferase-like protein [Ilyonectria robusta]
MSSFPAGHHADRNILSETLTIDPALLANFETQDTQHPRAQVPTFRALASEMKPNLRVTSEDMERLRCSLACSKFNNFQPDRVNIHALETHINLFQNIVLHHEPVFLQPEEEYLGRIGKGVTVGRPFTCTYGHNMVIGDNVNIGVNCTFDDVGKVQIGNNCFIGPNVTILTEQVHVPEGRRRAWAVTIEQGCLIEGGAIIMPGCTIGKDTVVGAGAVVTEALGPQAEDASRRKYDITFRSGRWLDGSFV